MKCQQDDRGVSVAVTHVLTVGITAILISGLLLGSSSMLETQQERSAESALETIGERLASEITSVNQTSDNASINTSHQRRVGGSQYTVSLNDSCSTPLIQGNPCLLLESQGVDATVAIPLSESIDVNVDTSVTGGAIIIKNEGSGIELRAAQ